MMTSRPWLLYDHAQKWRVKTAVTIEDLYTPMETHTTAGRRNLLVPWIVNPQSESSRYFDWFLSLIQCETWKSWRNEERQYVLTNVELTQRCRTVTLTLTEQIVWKACSDQCYPNISYFLHRWSLQFMWSAFRPAFVGFQPELRGVLSNRKGGRVTADLGLVVLPCKSHPSYLNIIISHVCCLYWQVNHSLCVTVCVCVYVFLHQVIIT